MWALCHVAFWHQQISPTTIQRHQITGEDSKSAAFILHHKFKIYLVHSVLCHVFLDVSEDFVLSYARRGEMLQYIKKLSCFDKQCTSFYAAEMVLALEHLHSKGIIHR